MSTREFVCSLGHVTKKVLNDVENMTVTTIACEFPGLTPYCGPDCDLHDPNHMCFMVAFRRSE